MWQDYFHLNKCAFALFISIETQFRLLLPKHLAYQSDKDTFRSDRNCNRIVKIDQLKGDSSCLNDRTSRAPTAYTQNTPCIPILPEGLENENYSCGHPCT